MISVNDLRNGMTIEMDGTVYQVIEFLHVKPGKGAAFVRTKLKNILTGATIETTFRAGEKVEQANVDRREYQFLYADQGVWVFMNNETFEQIELTEEQVGNAPNFLLENMTVQIASWKGQVIGVDLPNTVELKVVETEPGFKGDTATGTYKPAKLETGYVVQVPLFVNTGDVIKVDTRTGEYLSRA
ncbi:elongation factor P [Symbiobacterium thermophilum]|uniref:Elongation factor P n=2 Tax=Symbiobacterium thermophilum TaxID=2734 RepID=EFP_SYMTH|nr:elongation factor P [Symbiobacterium thermophilum]Q67N94.1 RecName: Full=Elongation factor P; Short=EF-P [Symbiobacterium thermophilum IAM 14863]MBY6275687.1 elongation factor P [Symbiobacterium thermophilum]BAD40849.1 translation elongation factor P [Symbiobacterium thermophilum IAM 14863]